MIQRLSKSWKQQKSGSTRQNSSTSHAAGLKKVKTSILRSTSADDKTENKQPPEKLPKRKPPANREVLYI